MASGTNNASASQVLDQPHELARLQWFMQNDQTAFVRELDELGRGLTRDEDRRCRIPGHGPYRAYRVYAVFVAAQPPIGKNQVDLLARLLGQRHRFGDCGRHDDIDVMRPQQLARGFADGAFIVDQQDGDGAQLAWRQGVGLGRRRIDLVHVTYGYDNAKHTAPADSGTHVQWMLEQIAEA